jgi:hypothetical protein
MAASGTFLLNASSYRWYVESATVDYPGFSHEPVQVLRIVGERAGFDVAIRLRTFANKPTLHAGPMVVLGDCFPSQEAPVPKGARIRLRPKVTQLSGEAVSEVDVSRIIAWCLSEHFRPVLADMSGMPQSSPQDDYSIGAPLSRNAA